MNNDTRFSVSKKLDFLYPSPLQFAAGIPVWAGLGDGVAAFKRQEYAVALREFSLLADQGDADAQFFHSPVSRSAMRSS